MTKAKITGTGMYVPDRVVTNDDLAELMDTSDEWIRQRSGIVERRWVNEGQTPADLAEAAARKALADADLDANDLDLILLATLSPEHQFPGTAFFLQSRLECGDTPCMEIHAQCSGFLFSLASADSFIRSGQYDRVMVVGCEVHSTGIELATRGRDVSVLFGDGAGAVILERNEDDGDPAGILESRMHSEGKYAKKLWLEGPASAYTVRLTPEMFESGAIYPKMEGRFVFKHAVTRMPQVLHEALSAASLKIDEIDLFLFHQANLRINEYVANQLEIPAEKTPNNIEKYGNCSAASIPMLLDEVRRDGRAKPGDLVSMTGFGSGFTWGSTIVRL